MQHSAGSIANKSIKPLGGAIATNQIMEPIILTNQITRQNISANPTT
jgi:hypothetical protein